MTSRSSPSALAEGVAELSATEMLSEKVKSTILDAAKKLTGAKKRAFMARVTEDYFDGSARKAETYLGWNRLSVRKGLREEQTGIVCADNYRARGRKKTLEKLPNLEADIRSIVDCQAQADPSFKSTFLLRSHYCY